MICPVSIFPVLDAARKLLIRSCIQDDSQGGEEEATQAYTIVRREADDEDNAVSA